ncbi:MAG: hypothetical protein ACU0DK_15100 [Pseudooceanicola sp.]
MYSPTRYADMPVRIIRFYGGLCEQNLRIMGEFGRAAMQPNPFLAALAELQWLGVTTSVPAPPAAQGAAAPARRGRRQPSKPPAMPERRSGATGAA